MIQPRLLFLSQTLPYPPDGGVKVRTFHILRLLAQEFRVTALCFFRHENGLGTDEVERRVDALRTFGHVEAFPIPQEHSVTRLLADHVQSMLRRRPYTVFTYESTPFRRALERQVRDTDFDIIHADSLDLSGYFPAVTGRPLVCVHHDAQSTLLRRRASREKVGWRRQYLKMQAQLMEREERRWCPRVSLNVTVSDVDRSTMEGLAPNAGFTVVPNGVDVDFFQPEECEHGQEGMVFVGGTSWFPNLDALEHFHDDILPLLRKKKVDEPVTWVGQASNKEMHRYQREGVLHLTGRVPDIRPFLTRAKCYIVPLRAGSGTRIKILDAWAMGKAVVSTSVGCEGLKAVDGKNILIRDTPDEFADGVKEVLTDATLRAHLEQQARHTAVKEYSWDAIGVQLIESYRALLDRS